jgi:aminoglycoside phosphotransferase (APT) family kinase protein
MRNLIASAAEVTPEWLTAVLRTRGLLARGCVTAVTPGDAQATFATTVWRLRVAYSGVTAADAPERLFLKVAGPAAPGDPPSEFVRREHRFYTVVAPLMDPGFAIPCYDAAYDDATGAAHLLLKDIRETHVACSDPEGVAGRAVDVLAELHAFWWDHPRLGVDIGQYPTQEERRQDVRGAEESTIAFMDACGDALAATWRSTYERVLAALPSLYARHATGRNLSLAHGDAHLGNFLFPHGPGVGRTHAIDWQFWHPTIGGTDLAFMIATHWVPETRRCLERPLLEQYYRGLLERGVHGYAWDACWDDYRLSVILVSIFIPVWQWSLWHWAPNLPEVEASMTAYEELGCEELLGREWG